MVTYFAYGSNMLLERLKERCPSAHSIDLVILPKHRVAFCKQSVDGSGKATIIEVPDNEAYVEGVLFNINERDLPALDAAEGKGKGYRRIDDCSVQSRTSGQLVSAITYQVESASVNEGLLPYTWYLALVHAGAMQHGLTEEYITELRTVASKVDPNPYRPAKLEAVRALKAVGFSLASDYSLVMDK